MRKWQPINKADSLSFNFKSLLIDYSNLDIFNWAIEDLYSFMALCYNEVERFKADLQMTSTAGDRL